MAITITMDDAYDCAMDVMRAKKVPVFISSPGIGKSALAKLICKKHNLLLIDIRLSQMDPADLSGFPFHNGSGKASYLPMDLFPLEGDKVPEGYAGWLILLDEFNSAAQAVQAASYKLVLDKLVGNRDLHRKCAMMMAGNLITDKAIVMRTGTALQSRVVWYELVAALKPFMRWANAVGLDHRVKAFLSYKPDMLHKFDPNHTENTFPCPRTWEFISDLIKPYPGTLSIKKLPTLAGAIGEGAGREFYSYTKIYKKIPSITEIQRNPTKVHIANEPSIQYALTGLVGHHLDVDNASDLMQFITRLQIDFQVLALKAGIGNDRAIMNVPAVRKWITKNSKEL